MAAASGKKGWISEQLCVQMGRSCNIYCVYCQNPPGDKPDSLKEAVARVRKRKIAAVSLEGGGEPTITPGFFEWIKALRKAGVKSFMLSTNAVALSDPDFCRRAAKELDHFTVNLPACDEAGYRRATRSVKFAMAMKGLFNLKRFGAEHKVRLFHIIYQGNYRSLPAYADRVAANYPGVALVNLTFVRNAGRVNDSPEIVPRYKAVEPYVKLALAKLKFRGIKAVIQNMPLCRLKKFEGFSFEFQRWRRGDHVLEEGIADKSPFPACAKCRLAPACCGARPDYLRIYGGKELSASAAPPEAVTPEAF